MPSFTPRAVHEFWKNYEDPLIYRVVSFMESVEKWVIDDNPEIQASLQQLGKTLDSITKFELTKEDHYINIACYLRSGTALRILQAIDTISPGSASRLLMYSEEKAQLNSDSPAGLFLRRNIVFERLRLLTRVFSPERLNLINKTLEQEDEE
jgi:intracellular multiplication protein IcmW